MNGVEWYRILNLSTTYCWCASSQQFEIVCGINCVNHTIILNLYCAIRALALLTSYSLRVGMDPPSFNGFSDLNARPVISIETAIKAVPDEMILYCDYLISLRVATNHHELSFCILVHWHNALSEPANVDRTSGTAGHVDLTSMRWYLPVILCLSDLLHVSELAQIFRHLPPAVLLSADALNVRTIYLLFCQVYFTGSIEA